MGHRQSDCVPYCRGSSSSSLPCSTTPQARSSCLAAWVKTGQTILDGTGTTWGAIPGGGGGGPIFCRGPLFLPPLPPPGPPPPPSAVGEEGGRSKWGGAGGFGAASGGGGAWFPCFVGLNFVSPPFLPRAHPHVRVSRSSLAGTTAGPARLGARFERERYPAMEGLTRSWDAPGLLSCVAAWVKPSLNLLGRGTCVTWGVSVGAWFPI